MSASQSPAVTEDPGYPTPAYAWFVVILLTLAYILSFIDRQILALMVEPMKRDLGLSDTGVSYLMGLAFGIFYTLMGIPLGRLADTVSRKHVVAAGIAVWCVMTACCGLARSYGQLFLARIGVGVGEAALTPSALSMISDMFPREQRGRAIGFYNMGISLGAGIAMILGGIVIAYAMSAPNIVIPGIGELYAWQSVFLLVGLPGLVLALVMLLVREPRRHDLLTAEGGGTALPLAFVARYALARWKVYGLLFFGMSVVTIIGYAYFSWVPTMFIRTHGWSIKEVGITYGVTLLICGPIGVNAAGWLADRLYRAGYSDGHLRTVLVGAAISLVGATLMPLMPTPALAVAMLIPANIGPAMATATGASSLMMITPNQMRGQMSALYLFVISILGLTVGPTAVAVVTDQVFGDEAALRYSIALVSGIAATLSLAVLSLNLAPYRRAIAESAAWDGSAG